ncbi:MAG: CDP-diacylglycerol--serine O-phosphatidyltransferase [Desulfomonilia bacterium]
MKKRTKISTAQRSRRPVPFLPNFITTIGLFFGFYSISFSLKGNFVMAAWMILLAGFIDGIDGRVARATNSTSAFGKEYDSLSDVIAFGVSPAIMAFLWQVNQFGRLGFIACFLFVACGALRLARFNTDSGDITGFVGLPIPIAAAAVSSMVLLSKQVGTVPSPLILIGMYVLSFMMVSTIRYPSFKHIGYIKAHPFQLLVGGLLVLVVVAMAPEIMIFALIASFVVGAPLGSLVVQVRRRMHEKRQEKETGHEHSA